MLIILLSVFLPGYVSGQWELGTTPEKKLCRFGTFNSEINKYCEDQNFQQLTLPSSVGNHIVVAATLTGSNTLTTGPQSSYLATLRKWIVYYCLLLHLHIINFCESEFNDLTEIWVKKASAFRNL